MKLLAVEARDRSSNQSNNYLVLRLVAASMVIHGHAFALAAHCESCSDLVTRFIGYRYSGDLGLHIFFVISGFLVTASYAHRHDLGQFARARALRILPAFWVCLAMSIFVFAAFSNLPLAAYFLAPGTWHYLLSNGSLLKADFGLPGVALSGSQKYGSVINGSIWSLFVEVRLYLFVAIVGSMQVFKHRATANTLLAALALAGTFFPKYLPMIADYSENMRLAAFFIAGMAMYINRDFIPLRFSTCAMLVLAAALTRRTQGFEIVAGAALAYGTFCIAYAPKIPLPWFVEDYSYGIYIFGWPVEQLIAHFWPSMGPYRMTVVALAVAWILGAASWHLIEKNALKWKSRPGSPIPSRNAAPARPITPPAPL
jgi:peptidoglycan/LPS O-acetylase OafA/YrhL